MNAIREWALAVTAASLASGIVYLLVPSGNMEKSVKVVVSLFVVLSLAAPLVGTKIDIDNLLPEEKYDESTIYPIEKTMEEQAIELITSQLKTEAESRLRQLGIKNMSIRIETDISSEKDISITMYLTIPDEYSYLDNEARSLLEKEFGVKAVIKYE